MLRATIQVRQTRHAGHCWRSRDKLISDVLLWTLTYGWAKVGWPAWTYIQQLCEDTGCNPEDLPEAMNNRGKWWERVRDIRVCGMKWWWHQPVSTCFLRQLFIFVSVALFPYRIITDPRKVWVAKGVIFFFLQPRFHSRLYIGSLWSPIIFVTILNIKLKVLQQLKY